MGKFFFTTPAKPFLGKIVCTFRDSWGNLFSNFRGFATQVENSHPYSSSVWDWPNPMYILTFLPNFTQFFKWAFESCKLWICEASIASVHKLAKGWGCFEESRQWANPILGRNRDGIFPLEWQSHESWKINFPMNHERYIIFSPRMA